MQKEKGYSMGEKKTCKLCGKEFVAKTKNRIYCSEQCAIKVRNQKASDWRKKKADKKSTDLNQYAYDALQAGMSYGNYVAMKERGARHE